MNTTTTTTNPIQTWQLAPQSIIVLGVYSNGAAKVKGYNGWERLAFLDCPKCHGEGEIRERSGWYMSSHYKQCEACARRFGLKEAIVARAKALIIEVKQDLKYAKWEGINVKDPAFIADYNVLNPHAQEYRRLLYQLWTYSEPEYTPLGAVAPQSLEA